MAYNLEVKQEARKEIFDSFFYYTLKVNFEIAQRFIDEVDEILLYIEAYPEHFQVKHKKYREAVLKLFPYVFIYEIIGNSVIVYSLFPTKDNPDKKP